MVNLTLTDSNKAWNGKWKYDWNNEMLFLDRIDEDGNAIHIQLKKM
jgi:hypothetical protein